MSSTPYFKFQVKVFPSLDTSSALLLIDSLGNVTVYFNSSGTKIGQIYYKQGSSTPVLTNWDPGYSQSNVDSSRTEQTTAVGVSRVDATCSVGYKVTLNVMKPGRITGFYYYIKPGVYKGYAEYEYETTILVPREVPVYEMKWVEE